MNTDCGKCGSVMPPREKMGQFQHKSTKDFPIILEYRCPKCGWHNKFQLRIGFTEHIRRSS